MCFTGFMLMFRNSWQLEQDVLCVATRKYQVCFWLSTDAKGLLILLRSVKLDSVNKES